MPRLVPSRRNLWPFSSSKKTPAPSSQRRTGTGLTLSRAAYLARLAGRKSQDEGEFLTWLRSKKLDDRSQGFIDRVKSSYFQGVADADAADRKREYEKQKTIADRQRKAREREDQREHQHVTKLDQKTREATRKAEQMERTGELSSVPHEDDIRRAYERGAHTLREAIEMAGGKINPKYSCANPSNWFAVASATPAYGKELAAALERRGVAAMTKPEGDRVIVYAHNKDRSLASQVYNAACADARRRSKNPRNKKGHDAWREYDAAAMDLARKGLKGKIGDPLPNLMSSKAVDLINDDPEAFETRVRQSAYALAMEKHNSTRRNSQESADEMYEKFHGRAPREQVVIEEDSHEHEHLSVLGDLAAIRVDLVTGHEATFRFDDQEAITYLCSSEDGTQLYIEGGDQNVDLKALGFDDEAWIKDRMVLGRFSPPRDKQKWNLAYFTQKDFDNFEDIEYQHDTGEFTSVKGKKKRVAEEDRVRPYLEYEPQNKKLFVTGGKYFISKPLFGTSPGIEN